MQVVDVAKTKPTYQHITIKHLAEETLSNEIARSILKIYSSPYKLLKAVLAVSVFVTTALSAYLCIASILNYFEFEVATTLRTIHETPTLYPRVTVCNINPFTTVHAYSFIAELNAQYFPQTDIFNASQMGFLTLKQRHDLVWRVYLLATNKMNSIHYPDSERQQLGHSIADLILECKYDNQACVASDFEWKFDKFYGNCFIFNKKGQLTTDIAGSWYGLRLSLYAGYYEPLRVINSIFGYGKL